MGVPLILALETATLGGSVCLVRVNTILAARIGDPLISHSHSLLRNINECVEQAGVELRNVDLFACTSGPGSFTGLRIGLATVKALAATLGRPCVGIPTLHAIAHAAGPSSGTVALLPAGRGEVFVQLLSVSLQGVVTELDTAAHLSPQKMLDKYGAIENLSWAGPAAEMYRDLLGNYEEDRQRAWILAPGAPNLAKHVAAFALHKFRRHDTLSPHSLRAIYGRPSDAEAQQRCP
jgi:tRNA threonylcarbamoyladenosine biosynthesis protein TsaB